MLRTLLQRADELRISVRGRERLRMFLHYLEHGANVSETCRAFSITRPTFYRLLKKFDPQYPQTLEDESRRPHHIYSVTVPLHTPVSSLQEMPLAASGHCMFCTLKKNGVSAWTYALMCVSVLLNITVITVVVTSLMLGSRTTAHLTAAESSTGPAHSSSVFHP